MKKLLSITLIVLIGISLLTVTASAGPDAQCNKGKYNRHCQPPQLARAKKTPTPTPDPNRIYTSQPDGNEGMDAMLIRTSPSTNFGINQNMNSGEYFGDTWRSLIRFNLGSIPSQAIVQSAQLNLWLAGSNFSNTQNMGVYRVTGDWAERLPNTRPRCPEKQRTVLCSLVADG